MAKKPQLSGGKSQRQRIWERIRKLGLGAAFDIYDIAPGGKTSDARDYLVGLAAAGYLTIEQQGKAPRSISVYSLKRDAGIEAPRVKKDGAEITQGSGNEAIWGAMQALGSFTLLVLTEMSGAKASTVQHYCTLLNHAGYLTVAREASAGKPIQYRLLKSKVQGPRPPQITRLKAVYDPNIHAIVWQQNADDALEAGERA